MCRPPRLVSRRTFGSIPSSRCQTTASARTLRSDADAKLVITDEQNPAGGARRDRTDDLLLAKQALSQLSYGPQAGQRPPRMAGHFRSGRRLQPKLRSSESVVGLGRFELPTSRLSSARSNQLSYKPKILLKQGRTGRRRKSIGTGSSAKKEKRRRRGPAKGMTDPETGLPDCS
jgi:hypothetical protein